MGGCCSIEDPDFERQRERRDNDRPDTIVISSLALHDGVQAFGSGVTRRPCYGEYTCPRCGRFWSSTLSWRNSYQVCKRCTTNVYPKNLRDLRPTDFKKGDGKAAEHSKNLCQKCRQLGYNCGNYNKRNSGQIRNQSISQIYVQYERS